MRSIIAIMIAAVTIAAVAAGAVLVLHDDNSSPSVEIVDPVVPNIGSEEKDVLVRSINGFAWDFLDGEDGNVVFSPYGICTTLGMLLNGSEPGSSTEAELKKLLHVDDVKTFNETVRTLSALIGGYTDEGRGFGSSNLVLVDESVLKEPGVSINREFESIVQRYYDGSIREVDFRNSLETVKETIRAWVEERTHGLIPGYESIATERTVTDLLNVVHFKGDWRYKFESASTFESVFHNADGTETVTDMMHTTVFGGFRYYDDGRYTGIELPYSLNGVEAALYVIIPTDHGTDMTARWKGETVEYRETFLSELRKSPRTAVTLALPKLDVESKIDLCEKLKSMGLTVSFTDDARYTEMLDGCPLKIGGAKHQAKVVVDEEGTEAAAVTEITMEKVSSALLDPTKSFNCDVPFVFTLSESTTGMSLFAGFVEQMDRFQNNDRRTRRSFLRFCVGLGHGRLDQLAHLVTADHQGAVGAPLEARAVRQTSTELTLEHTTFGVFVNTMAVVEVGFETTFVYVPVHVDVAAGALVGVVHEIALVHLSARTCVSTLTTERAFDEIALVSGTRHELVDAPPMGNAVLEFPVVNIARRHGDCTAAHLNGTRPQ